MPVCFIDAQIDDALEEGLRDECIACSKPVVVTAVDYDVTVFIDRAPLGGGKGGEGE